MCSYAQLEIKQKKGMIQRTYCLDEGDDILYDLLTNNMHKKEDRVNELLPYVLMQLSALPSFLGYVALL